MSGHRVRLSFEDGGVWASLICPEKGCEPASLCVSCGRDTRDAEQSEPCPDCPTGDEPCWLATWAEGGDLIEYLTGEVTVEANGLWEGDYPLVEVYDPERAA